MQALRESAEAALAAPSIFNTQPWCWQISGDGALRLWADRSRQLMVADPDGRLLTISCGAALHHAQVALFAAGHMTDIERLPDLSEPDLLAEIRVTGHGEPTESQLRLREAIRLRRTDRRAFHRGVPTEDVAALVEAAESHLTHLHLLSSAEVSTLAAAATYASAVQLGDREYRKQLIHWTHRPTWSDDGVPVATAVEPSPRSVPVRDFVPFSERGMPAGPHTDVNARYAVFFTDEDKPLDWLRSGEAVSAVLLTATSLGLGSAPISDVTELALTREQLRRHLLAGVGVPQLALRVGQAPPGSPPSAPRRASGQVIYSPSPERAKPDPTGGTQALSMRRCGWSAEGEVAQPQVWHA